MSKITASDFYDAMPETKARNSDKFLVVNSTKYYPEFVNKTSSKEKSDACYGKGTYNTNELIDIQCRAASFVVYLYGGILYNEDNTPLIVPDAAANLDHFLQNTGTDFEINVESLLSSSSYAEGLYKSYKDNMAEYVEDILKKGDTLIIGTRNDVNDGNGFVAFSKNIQRMFFDINWSTGFGECNSCMLGYYTHTYDNDYVGKCIYTVFDFYDWEENGAPIGPEFIIPSDGELYKLHHAGWAKHYYMSGSYTTEHNWVVN